MASYKPISGDVIQRFASNVAASGYYLKGYVAGTTTALAMGVDSTPSSTLAKCQINSEGYPINGSSAVFIPHFNADYKLVLYSNSTDADADTFANAVYVVDNLQIEDTTASDINYDQGGTGSVVQTVQSRLRYKKYFGGNNIDNTGVEDVSADIQSLIDQYGRIEANAGTYNLGSGIFIYDTGMAFLGMSPQDTMFTGDSGATLITVGNDATSNYTNHDIKVSGFKVTGGSYGMALGGNGTGAKAFLGEVSNVVITGATTAGLLLVSPQGAAIMNCNIRDNAIGIYANNSQAVTASTIFRTRIYNNSSDGIRIHEASGLNIIGSNIESNGGWGIQMNKQSGAAIVGINVSNCWFEANVSGSAYSDDANITDLAFISNYFNGTSGTYHLDINASAASINYNRFLTPTTSAVRVNNACVLEFLGNTGTLSSTPTSHNGLTKDQSGNVDAKKFVGNAAQGSTSFQAATGNIVVSDGILNLIQSTNSSDGAQVASLDINGSGSGVDVVRINCGSDADRVALKFTIAGVISSYIWVDDTGQPRFNTSLPTSATNGTAL